VKLTAQNGHWSRYRLLQGNFPKPVIHFVVPDRSLSQRKQVWKSQFALVIARAPLAANSTDCSLSGSGTCPTRNWNAGLLEWHGGSRNHEVLLRAGGHNCDWDQN